jgi:glycosyltransferase involved in cell wall biosynthesis
MTANLPFARRRRVTIVTSYGQYYGGVEHVNSMLIGMLENEGNDTNLVSQDLLWGGPLLKVRKRLFGLNRILAYHFAARYAADTDVVICNGEFGYGINHRAAIVIFHGCYHGYASAMQPHVSVREYRGLMALADQQKRGAAGKYVVAVSRTLASILELQGIRVDAVINNAVDTMRFQPVVGIARNDRCLFVGAADYYGKGFDTLEKLADLGVGIDCVTSIRPKDTRLAWLGNVPNERLPEYYPRYKAFLLPSRFEGCGLVSLEAMACGTPVVMTSVGAGPDIASEIPEFVVDGRDSDLPNKIVDRLGVIERQRQDLAVRARGYVLRHHGYAAWKRKWLDTLDIVQRRSGGHRS